MTYSELKADILQRPTTHKGLMDAIKIFDSMDCIDACVDTIMLQKLFSLKADEIVKQLCDSFPQIQEQQQC